MPPALMPGEPERSGDRCIEDARTGSPDALGRLLERFRTYLLQLANRHLDQRLSAKGGGSDLVQMTFLDAQQSFAHFRGRTDDELRAWLTRMLECNVLDFSRRYFGTEQRRIGLERPLDEVAMAVADPRPEAHQQLADEDDARRVEAALAALPEDYRRVVELRYRENRSFEEVGRLLGRSPEAAQKLWYRAVRALQERLGGGDDGRD